MSSDPTDPQAFPEEPLPAEKPGMSSGSKVLIIVLVILGILALVCCGGMALFFYYAKSYVGDAISDDPAVVRAQTEEIASISMPEQLEPLGSMNMTVPFSGQSMMTWEMYADQTSNTMLMLASFGDAFAGQNQEQMQMQMEQSLQSQGMGNRQDVNITERYEREIEVRGQPVTFFFAKGTEANSESPRIEVTGTFQGSGGMVMLMLYADEETLDEEQIVEMIESIE